MSITVELPLTPETTESLRAGDEVILNGPVYLLQETAFAQLSAALNEGREPPFAIGGQTVYYPGQNGGIAAPAISNRLERDTIRLLEAGLRGLIGLGSHGPELRTALEGYDAVYFGAIGSTEALLARHVSTTIPVTATIQRLELNFFPARVVYDCHGGDLYLKGRPSSRREA